MLRQNPSTSNVANLNVTHFNFWPFSNSQVADLQTVTPINFLQEKFARNTENSLMPSKTASKQLYFDLSRDNFTQHDKLLSQLYLNEKLMAAEELESDLPANLHDVISWMEQHNAETTRQYQEYLNYRNNG